MQTLSLSDPTARRIGFTLGALVVWRLGTFVPLPGIDLGVYRQLLAPVSGGPGSLILGEAVTRLSLFGLGVTPYVGGFVLMHILCAFSRGLREMRRAGGAGGRQFNQWVRAAAVLLAVFQGYGIAFGLEGVRGLVPSPGPGFRIGVVASLVAGTIFLVWLGEQISARGVGNGVWLIFAAGYVASLPATVAATLGVAGSRAGWTLPLCLAALVGLTALIVLVERAERRLAIGDRPAGGTGGMPFLSLRLDNTGVLAPMLATALVVLPAAFATLLEPEGRGGATDLAMMFSRGQPLFMLLYAGLIVLLAFFFTGVVVDSRKLAAELGGQQGRAVELVDGVLARLTLIGAAYLVVLCLVPEVLIAVAGVPLYLGGVGLLVVGLVALGILDDVARADAAGSP